MGNEFRVNDFTDSRQYDPDILTFPDGRFLIAWGSRVNIDSFSGEVIAAQLYGADGSRIGNNFVIDARQDADYRKPSLTLLADGGFVVAYEEGPFSDVAPETLYLRVYNDDLSERTTARVRVDTLNTDYAKTPDVVALDDGGFMVVSTVRGAGEGIITNIFARRFDDNGVPQGTEFQLNTVANDQEQVNPFAATLSNGNVIVIWDSESTGENPGGAVNFDETRASILRPDGSVLRADFVVVPDSDGVVREYNTDISVTALEDGGFAVSWYRTVTGDGDTRFEIVWRRFDNNGNATSGIKTAYSETEGVPDSSHIVELAGGNILVVWDAPNPAFQDVFGKVFSPGGTALTGTFNLAQNRDGDQEVAHAAAFADGGFVVTYDSDDIDADNTGIAARTFGRGTDQNDTVTIGSLRQFAGLDGDDSIIGSRGADYITGGRDDDRVNDRGGNDYVALGSGDDYIRVGGGRDVFNGGAGTDLISYFSSPGGIRVDLKTSDISGSWGANDRIISFEGFIGSETGDDTVRGTDTANLIRTYGGDDRVLDRKGSDEVSLGAGDDYVRVGGGQDSFDGGSGRDYISYIDSSGGVNIDLKYDTAAGSWAANDAVVDFEGVTGSATGDDRLVGTDGGNTLRGSGGEDMLFGRKGSDRLFGGANSDRIDGGEGTDRLWGGSGTDVFHFDRGDDNDRIYDFQNNADTLEFDGFSNGFDPFEFADQVGDDVVFTLSGGDRITIENITVGQLQNDVDVV